MFLSYIQKNRVSVTLFVLYALLIGFFMYHHDMWRDEIEYFLYRKHHGITNPGDPCYLAYNIPANFLMLFGSSFGIYKAYHFFIIIFAAGLLLFCSPFNNIEKLFITFSYYMTYEYGIMSRYYGMFCLLVFLITWLLASRRENYISLSILILLLADLNSSGTLLAGCLSLYAAYQIFSGIKNGKVAWKGNLRLKVGITIALVGWMALAVIFKLYLLSLAKNLMYSGVVPPLHIAVSALLNAYIPIPDWNLGASFWSSHIFGYRWCFPENFSFSWSEITPHEICSALVSLLIFLVIAVRFLKARAVAYLYIISTLVMVGFFKNGMKVFPSRYLGLLFLILVYSYWLFKSEREKTSDHNSCQVSKENNRMTTRILNQLFKPVLYIILFSQLIASVFALNICSKHKFTLSQDAAAFIKWNNFQKTHVLVGYPDYAAQCISAHLDQQIFYPQQGRFAHSSGDFLDDFKRSVSSSELFSSCLNFTEGEGKKVLLILDFPIMADEAHMLVGPVMMTKKSSIKLIKAITGDVVNKDEQFWLYEIDKAP